MRVCMYVYVNKKYGQGQNRVDQRIRILCAVGYVT